MKWPFARHAHPATAPAAVGDGSITIAAPARADTPGIAAADVVAPARREWATLPPLQVAGGRPISLTVAARAFTEGLATQQVLVRAPRLEMVRQIDAPSGSFRGVLAPAVIDHDSGSTPDLQESSPLPVVEHRHVTALAGEQGGAAFGRSAVEQLLAIEPGVHGAAGLGTDPTDAFPTGPFDEPTDGGPTAGGRRAGLADSRRRGLGPAYHGPLPEAMRAERERDEGPSGGPGVSSEPVPGDVRATMRDVLGIDIGDRMVHRGPAVSAEASSMGAQAFTRDGQIYVHDDVGPLDQARGRATVAHELTHAAQQIVHGVLHDEATETGRALEAHAQRVEQFVRGDGGAVKPTPDLLHARPANDQGDTDVVSSAQQMMREMVDSGLAKSDGNGGIVFTMPPSSMTASAGTQRLAGDTPTAHAASQTHWDPLASFGNTLGQGLGNDVLGIAGSMFGFSDEFMGEQRHGMVGEDRHFKRDQITHAFTELRLEHLRRVELTNLNDTQARHDLARSEALDTETLHAIDNRVREEVQERLALLDAQSAIALQRLNQQRATRQEAALLDVPDENFNRAMTELFDNADNPVMPTDEAMLATLAAPPTTPGRTVGAGLRPGGATTMPPRPGATPSSPSTPGTPAATPAATPTGTPATSAATTTPTTPTATASGLRTPPGGTAATPAHEEHWRTDATVGGRFQALGAALGADIAHDQIETFGSLFGFGSEFEQSMHDDIDGQHGATAAARTTAAAPAATTTPPHADAAHPDAAHAAAATHAADAHHAATQHPGAAHDTVDRIVGDPYALDELATRLYPNLRSRLRQELLIDRERAGLLADFR